MENPKFTSNTQIEESGQWKNNGWNVTPSSTYGGNVGLGWKAFDKNPNNEGWVSSKRWEAPNSGHLTITYPSIVNVSKMILYLQKHFDGRPGHSQTYTIQVSKDGSSFTNVNTSRKIVEEKGNVTIHEIVLDTPISGKLFRFTARGIESVGLAEWKIFTGSTTAPPTSTTAPPTSTTAPPTFQTPLPTTTAPIQNNSEDFSKYYTNENGDDISFNKDEMSCAVGCYEDDSCKGFAYDAANKVCKPMNSLQETVPETFNRYRKKSDRVQINKNIKVELKYNISNNKAVVGQDYKTTSGLGIEYNQNAKVMHIVNQLSESKKLTHQYIPFTIQPIGNKYHVIANNAVLGKLKIKDSQYVVEK